MNTSINVVCSTDDNYVPLCGIMLTSLFENHKDTHVVVYILTKGLSPRNIAKFNKLLHDNKYNAEIHLCIIDEKLFDTCPIHKGDHWSIAAYYRFLIPEVLPSGVSKALYIDCDVLILDSLQSLFSEDISNVAVGVCEEDNNLTPIKESIKRLGYPSSWGYFNSGVMLINVDYWRKHNVTKTLFFYVANNHEKCKYADQDTLNAVLGNQKRFLHYKYNLFLYLFLYGFDETIRAKYLKERPSIFHYCCPGKPWDWYLPDYPFKMQWEYYRSISPWKYWIGNMPLKDKIRRFLIIWSYKLRKKDLKIYDNSWKIWK